MGGLPLGVTGRWGGHGGQQVSSLPPSVSLLVPVHSSVPAGSQAADSQLGQPVYAGQTGVQVRRHDVVLHLQEVG